MSFRELTMIDVKEVLRRWAAGQSARQMAREGVVSRRTASRYIEAAMSLGLAPSDELTDERVRGVAQCVQARPLPAVSDPRQLLETREVARAGRAAHTSADSRAFGSRWHRRVVRNAEPLGTDDARHRQPEPDRARG